MIRIHTFKTADLNRAMNLIPVGDSLSLFKIPAGAKLISAPSEDDFNTSETVSFTYDDGQPVTYTVEIGEHAP